MLLLDLLVWLESLLAVERDVGRGGSGNSSLTTFLDELLFELFVIFAVDVDIEQVSCSFGFLMLLLSW